MYLNPSDQRSASSSGKPVVLDMSTTPTPTPEGGLQVAGPASVEANGGNPGTLLGGTANGSPAPAANSLPGPNDFRQYEAESDKPTALYIDVVVGQGKEVAAGSQVSVMYRGWLTDGTLFDENYSRNQVFTFKEGDHHVIPGWEEGLFGMKVGGKRRLIVPASSGYGSKIYGPIPANSMLIFDIELVDVK
jgi:FKBP-type peptidyl-prolyl cis-trans isomerase FkpA